MDKLTSAVTVKFAPDDADDLHALASSRGMEVSEYIRHLIAVDQAKAASDLSLLADALGCEVIRENLGTQGYQR